MELFTGDEVFASYSTGPSGSLNADKNYTVEPDPDWLHYYHSNNSETVTAGSLSISTVYENNLKSLVETKAFAAQGADIAVMILNHSANTQSVVLRFDGTTPASGASNYKRFSFAMGKTGWNDMVLNTALGGGWDAAIDPNSTHVIIINCGTGSVKKRFRYRLGHETSAYNNPFSIFYPASGNGGVYTITAVASSTCMQPVTGAAITVTGFPAGSSFTWYRPPATAPLSGTNGSVLSSASYTAISPGLYQAVVTSSDLCQAVSVSAVLSMTTPLVDAGKSLTFCPGVSTSGVLGSTLLATSAYGGYSYSWQPGGASSATSATMAVNNTVVTSSQYYTLTASDGACSFNNKVFVEVEDDIQLIIKDDLYDVGLVPTPSPPPYINPYSYPPWISPDIYANYMNNATLGDAYIQPGTTAYVKVRVHNKGCMPLLSAATVSLYYTAAGVGNNWSTAWVNYPCSSVYATLPNYCAISSTPVCGNFIGTVNTPTIPAKSSAVVVFTWTVPPDYNCFYGGPKAGFKNIYFNNWTLKAIVDHPQDMKSTLTSNAYYNVTHDNNVAAKKVVRYVPEPFNPNNGPSGIYVFNNQSSGSVRLDFISRDDYNNESVLNYGNAIMYFPHEFLQQWVNNGEQGEGVVLLSDTSVQIISANAYMDDFPLLQYHAMPAGLMVFPTHQVDLSGGESFDVDVILRPSGDADSIVGGITYQIMKEEWDCGDCGGTALRQSFTTTDFEDDSLHIISDFTISAGQTRTYERCVLRFAQNTRITVAQGGKLVLKNSRLEAACKHQEWGGIRIEGAVNGFTAESCNFRNTSTPIHAENAEGLLISGNAIIGINQCTGVGIRLHHSSGFNIRQNHIARFSEGISTSQTYTNPVSSAIERNVMQLMETCIRSLSDDHTATGIACNTFRYLKYGVYADSSDFSNFGSPALPAGNRFKGKSNQVSHKINHNAGNSPAYYYSASLADSTGMNITTVLSANEIVCYPADSTLSSSSSRIASLTSHHGIEFGLKAIPNPGSNEMLIVASLAGDENGRLLIRDAQGRLIGHFEIDGKKPELNLDWTGKARGIYFATLELSSGHMAHVKLLVQD